MHYTVTNDGFLRLPVLDADYEWATKQAAEMGALNNSIREGEGNLAGFIGEALVRRAFIAGQNNTYNFDLLFQDEQGQVSFEVKTKDRTVPPRPDYMASVAAYNTRQKADWYVFVSLVRPNRDDHAYFSEGYICGMIAKADYLRYATFRKRGEIDPTDGRGWRIKADCYNLAYSELWPLHSLDMAA